MLFWACHTALGEIFIVEENNKITHLCFQKQSFMTPDMMQKTPLLNDAFEQLQEYLAGKRKIFNLPLCPIGTAFQKRVWQELLNIPYGETASYKEIAEKIGCTKAYRAVGLANNKNPIPIFIPCHRVIGSNGKLVGYAGGLNIKSQLLNIEALNK